MVCKNCNNELSENAKFCTFCGARVEEEVMPVEEPVPVEEVTPAPEATPVAVPQPEQTYVQPQQTYAQPQQTYVQPQQTYAQPQQVYSQPKVKIPPANYVPPAQYKPISAWGYIGWNILFAIPLVGWILILIFGLGGTKNINLKNYARSFLIVFLLALGLVALIFVVIFILTAVMGASMSTMYY